MIYVPGTYESYGIKAILVNGKIIKHVFYCDDKKGLVKYYPFPFRLHKHGKRVISKTVRGIVEVVK